MTVACYDALTVACYDVLADAYADRAETSRVSIKATLNEYMIPLLPVGGRVLDVGCAVGVATEELYLAGMDVIGIDSSEEMIRIARRDRKVGVLRFQKVDYTEVTFVGLDGILAFAFLHLFPKSLAPELLNKMYSELRPGGLLYAGTTVEQESREGWEAKEDYGFPDRPTPMPQRYRARYADGEFEEMVAHTTPFLTERITEHCDEFGKLWRDVLVRRPM